MEEIEKKRRKRGNRKVLRSKDTVERSKRRRKQRLFCL